MEFLLDNYYDNLHQFQIINSCILYQLEDLNVCFYKVNVVSLPDGYISIGPHINYLEEYPEIKSNINKLVLKINYNYDQLSYITGKMGDNFTKIMFRDYTFEDNGFFSSMSILNELRNKIPINRTIMFV